MSIERQLKASAAHVKKLKKDIADLRQSHQTEIDTFSTEILNLCKLNLAQSEKLPALRDKAKSEVDQVVQILINELKKLNINAKSLTFYVS